MALNIKVKPVFQMAAPGDSQQAGADLEEGS